MGTHTYTNCTPCCGNTVSIGCCGVSLPATLLVTVTDKTGSHTALPDTFLITYNSGTGYWENNSEAVITCSGNPTSGFHMNCNGTTPDDFTVTELNTNPTVDAGGSCDPVLLVWAGRTIEPDNCTGADDGSATFTVTIP